MSRVNTGLVVLVTGGNRGIGLATVQKFAASQGNFTVLIGSRSEEEGQHCLEELHAKNLAADWVKLDVTDDASIQAAVETVRQRYGKLDVLINNAGMANDSKIKDPHTSLRALFIEQFDTNLFGPAQVTEAFIPLLKKANSARVVFVSSSLGSITHRLDPANKYYTVSNPIYRTSKAALNMVCAHYAAQFEFLGWKVNTVDPGHVATRLNDFKGPCPVEDAANQIFAVATVHSDGPNGTFTNKDGIVPW